MKKEHFEIPKAPITPYRVYFLKLDLIRKIYFSPVVKLAAEPKGKEKKRNDNRPIGLPQDGKRQFDLQKKSQISGTRNSKSKIFKSLKDKRKKEMEHLQAQQNVQIHKTFSH